MDPELNVLSLKDKKGAAIGTLVRWSCHPEVLGRDNFEATADYPGALCARVEEKTGGACVFFSGVIGGLLGPDIDRSRSVAAQFEDMETLGVLVADAALAALEKDADRIEDVDVSFTTRLVRVPVEN